MGVIKQGILGGFKGKTGTVVGSTWRGISYMRGLPINIHNPNTEAQQLQRAKFGLVMKTLRPMTPLINIGFRKYAVQMTCRNAALRHNIRACITGTTAENVTVNWELLSFSLGTLTNVDDARAVYDEATDSFHFSWTNNAGKAEARNNDNALLLVYNVTQQDTLYVSEGIHREDGGIPVARPRHWKNGDQCQAYIAFTSPDYDTVSNSRWIGEVIVG